MGKTEKINVGGQAVLEGVMMRSPDYVSVAVRKRSGKIILKRDKYVSWTKRHKFLGIPFVRGGVILIESLVLGIKALNFSGDVAMAEEEKKELSERRNDFKAKLLMGATVVFALGVGIAFFFYVPLLVTGWMHIESGVLFNVVDGALRLAFFLIYLALISLWKEIRRVFEYHGAEHKSIFAFEDGRPLTVKEVQSYTTHHPRCGTSFLLVVMLVALLVFIILGKPDTVGARLIRFCFIPVIGGLSYEIIRLSGTKRGKKLAKILVAPGLWLQRITTKEPDESQLEVALVALRSALGQEIDPEVEVYAAS